MKYIIVGGVPVQSYTGTLSFTAIEVVGTANFKEECNYLTTRLYRECGGLLAVIDTETGKLAQGVDFGKD